MKKTSAVKPILLKSSSRPILLTFPYKAFIQSDAFRKLSASPKFNKEGRHIFKPMGEYYKALHKKFFPCDQSDWAAMLTFRIGVLHFPLIPLALICELYEDIDKIRSYAEFFRNPDKSNAPICPFSELLPSQFDWIFERMLCFYHAYRSPAFHVEGAKESAVQIEELKWTFDNYLLELEEVGNDEVRGIIFDMQKHVESMFKVFCDLRWEPFVDGLMRVKRGARALERAFYKLECACYYDKAGISKNDMGEKLDSLGDKMHDMHKDVRKVGHAVDCGFARNDNYAWQQGLRVPMDLSGERRGKWARGWHKRMVDKVFSSHLTGSGRGFDKICHEVYADNKKDFDARGISYDAFKRACDRQKTNREKKRKNIN